ncbi:hypothetical protein M3175_18465 [Robertmurraya korlensis]|uniref:hypothetical protein n=1 Tax=Robertmurraya korlensis TaxID=519977 RepID=UPI002040C2DC|nr:hypothetical protein [Robertmurraya korlensis]MCM3602723.1 hypothetical protein [Robertmurraya korlensis]
MYVNKEVVANSSSNEKGIKIGPDAIRFKYVDDEMVKHSPLYVEGIIFAVGLDFVEVLQKDHKIVTVLTDRITHVKWPDKEVREAVSHCKHDGNCRCVTLHRFIEEEKRGDKMNKNLKHSKKGKKGDPHHCAHCGNYHSRLNPCRCKKKRPNHGRPCGCKQNHRHHDHRPCGCNKHHDHHAYSPCRCQEHHDHHAYSPYRCHEHHSHHDHSSCRCHSHHEHKPCRCHEHHSHHDHSSCRCHNHHGHHHHCTCCQDEHHKGHMQHHDCCHRNFVCFSDFAIPFCNDRFALRLAGLTDDLNSRFLQNRGRHVEMIVE